MPLSEDQTIGGSPQLPVEREAEQIPVINIVRIIIALVLFLLVCIGGIVVYNRPKSTSTQIFVPPLEPTPSPTVGVTTEITNSPVSPTVSDEAVVIPVLSTEGWKQVSNDGVSFLIPPDSLCMPSETDCDRVLYTWYLNGRPITSTVYVDIQTYKGGSRRAQFLETHDEILNCNPLYVESLFGTVRALQIGSDGGMCQGGGGGIVTVVGDKLIIFRDLSYNSDTKQFPRFGVRDTIISTLR